MIYESIFKDGEGLLEEAAIDAGIRYYHLIAEKIYKEPIYLKSFIRYLDRLPIKGRTGLHNEISKWCKAVLGSDASCIVSDSVLRHRFEFICTISNTVDPIRVIEDIVFCLISIALKTKEKTSYLLVTPDNSETTKITEQKEWVKYVN